MGIFLTYIRDFIRSIDPLLFLFTCLFTAVIIFLNYRYGIEPKMLSTISNRVARFGAFYIVYLIAFAVPYLLYFTFRPHKVADMHLLLALILLAPAFFSLKVNFTGLADFIYDNVEGMRGRYFSIIASLPSKLLVVIALLLPVWWMGNYESPFFGLTTKHLSWKPYFLMLLMMVPLIAWASTQADFLHTYPKLRQVYFVDHYFRHTWLHKLLYELSYGIDFVTIELFFRGFLVLAFVRFAGQDAILPMAVFYCCIHFGKPLAECISSYFGGIILGIVVFHTRSIWGGLVVHVGIAWLMELGAVAGNYFREPS